MPGGRCPYTRRGRGASEKGKGAVRAAERGGEENGCGWGQSGEGYGPLDGDVSSLTRERPRRVSTGIFFPPQFFSHFSTFFYSNSFSYPHSYSLFLFIHPIYKEKKRGNYEISVIKNKN